MAKVTQHSDIIADNLLKPTIDEFGVLNGVLVEAKGHFKDILKITKDGVSGNFGSSAEEIKKLTAAYSTSKTAAEELASVNLLLAKTEQEQLKTKILLTKEQERQAKATQKEVGAYQEMSKTLNSLRNQYKNLAAANHENTKEGRALLKSVTDLDKKLKDIDATVGQHQRNVGNYKDALSALPGPLGQAVHGVSELGKTFKLLLANPVVLLITLIVGALMALFNAFTKTDEGGTKFAALMEQISAIMNVVMQRVGMLANSIMLLFDGKYSEAADQFKEAITGVGDQMERAATAAKEYINALDVLEDAEISYISQRAKGQNIIAKLEYDAANRGKTVEERRNALQQAIALSKEESEKQKEFLQKRYEIELEYAAKLYNVDAALLKKFIEADDKTGLQLLKNNKTLADARNKMNDEGQKKLEEAYAKAIEAATKFFEENKRNASKLTGFDEQIKKEAIDREIKYLEELKKLQEKQLTQNKKQVDAALYEADRLANEEKIRLQKQKEVQNLEIEMMKEGVKKKIEIRKKQYEEEKERLYGNHEALKLLEKQFNEDIATIQRQAQVQKLADLAKEMDQILERREQRRLKAIDKEVQDSKDLQDKLRQLAIAGNKDAEASIALEDKRQLELEAKREKELKNAKKRELVMAAINTYNSKVQAGDKNALASTLKDLTLLGAALATIPGFFLGTEDTGPGGDVDGKGGFLSILHPREKVFNRRDAAKIGYDVPNSVVADTMDLVNRGLMVDLTRMPSYAVGGDGSLLELRGINKTLSELKEVTAKIKQPRVSYDVIRNVITEEIKDVGKTERWHWRGRGIRP